MVSSLLSSLEKISDIAHSKTDDDKLAIIVELLLHTRRQEQSKTLRKLPVSISASSGGNFSIFGPTSAFYNVMDMTTNPAKADLFDNALMNSSSLMVCLCNFFKWQYPDIAMFIHRESFLNDFINPLSNQGYCSEELVYAIAALGAKCSKDASLRQLALSFFETLKSKIFSKKICQPQINTLQALLCLALYELGDGNASASWMLSGMAIRMGYDLGFQLNPQDWSITGSESADSQQAVLTKMDVMVRSRIYWGCYVFDHFVSLVMGRPVTVRKSEASVPSSEHLPDSNNIEEYVFHPPDTEGSVANLDVSATLRHLCSLSECVGSLLSDIFSSDSGEGFTYLSGSRLDRYNDMLAEWRAQLPPAMRWTGKLLSKQLYNPTVLNFRLFYYVILLCLNKPFLTSKTDARLSPHDLCNEAVSDLANCLSKFNEAQLPLSVLIVYSSILGISVILTKVYTLDASLAINEQDLYDLKVFYTTISSSCQSWKLASKSLMFIQTKISELNIPSVSSIFEAAEVAYQDKLTQREFDEIMELSGDVTTQDNLFANFFEFFNDEELGRVA